MCCPVARFLFLAGVAGLVLFGGLSCRPAAPAELGKVPAFELTERPDKEEMRELAERWRPWRGVAARLLWAYYAALKQRTAVPV